MRYGLNFSAPPPVDGETTRRAHAAPTRFQGDVFRGRPVLDVQDSNPPLPGRRGHLPGLAPRHHPRGAVRPAGLHGRLLCDPPPLCVHLHHVPRGGDTETEQLGAHRGTTREPPLC